MFTLGPFVLLSIMCSSLPTYFNQVYDCALMCLWWFSIIHFTKYVLSFLIDINNFGAPVQSWLELVFCWECIYYSNSHNWSCKHACVNYIIKWLESSTLSCNWNKTTWVGGGLEEYKIFYEIGYYICLEKHKKSPFSLNYIRMRQQMKASQSSKKFCSAALAISNTRLHTVITTGAFEYGRGLSWQNCVIL